MLLGTKTGWSEKEILSMPLARFNFYIDLLTRNKDDE
jgi:hypothetical protein